MVWKEIYYKEMTPVQRQQIISEVNILKDLNHQHIIKYYDRIVQKN